jgi:hypothetical protein
LNYSTSFGYPVKESIYKNFKPTKYPINPSAIIFKTVPRFEAVLDFRNK